VKTRPTASKDVLAGIIFLVIGVVTFLLARRYELGVPTHMGPGFFPALVAGALSLIGVAAIVRGLGQRDADPIEAYRIQPLVLVFAGVLAFSLLIERAGLVVASAALIGIVCLPRLRTNPIEVLITYVVLTGFAAIVFVRLLDMQLPLFWWE
jgi:asparagine N-glycosylation enzyme membrane subunit Stt3